MLSVTTNTAAMTSQRNLAVNSENASNSIARMSSGTRIVKPSDDASSLAISNKLRSDIAALEQAGRNASQGASLLQVANGAYDRIGDMLTRMKVLATQVINGTLSTSERLFAQTEFSNLSTQITNTASQTRFAGVSLLSGGGGSYLQTGAIANSAGTNANTQANLSVLTDAATGLTAGTNDFFDATLATNANAINTGFVNGAISDVRVTISGQAYQVSLKVGNQSFTGRIDSSNNTAADLVTLTSTSNSANTIQFEVAADIGTGGALAVSDEERTNVETGLRILLNGATYTAINSAGTTDNGFTGVGGTIGVDQNGVTVPVRAGAGTAAGTYQFQYISTGDETVDGATGFNDGADERRGTGFFLLTNGAESWTVDQKDIQIVGEEGSAGSQGIITFSNGLQVYIDLADTAANAFDRGTSSTDAYRFDVGAGGGVNLNFQVSDKATDQVTISFASANASSLGLDGLSISDETSAATASARLDTAINIVNTAQATLGAVQSRFEYIQSTISTTVENVSASRGIFRDVDMAAEMTKFTTSQTLMQASVAMLSQANQLPQQLLRLLQ